MPKLSIWNSGRKGADYRFIDGTISEFFTIGGTAVYVHKYIGVQNNADQQKDADGNLLPAEPLPGGEIVIQDIIFLENRDRCYAPDIYEMRGIYNVQDAEFDLSQFGLFLENDTIFMEFHLNDMIKLIGRKLMSGDVLELPHLRDDALLDPEAPAINKFYSISDAQRASDGYSQTWFPHIWRVKCKPLTNSQEYDQILDQNAKDPFGLELGDPFGDDPTKAKKLRDTMINMSRSINMETGDETLVPQEHLINEEIVDKAREFVAGRYFQTEQYYIVPGDELGNQYPWIFAGDGIPPDSSTPVDSGNVFPDNPNAGDYYLRTDYEPNALYCYTIPPTIRSSTGIWLRQELDYRQQDWSMASRVLLSFINNNKTTTLNDGTTVQQRQPLSQVVRPRADF
jgi:hypothetical protein